MIKGQLEARKPMSRHEWTATMWKPIRLVSTWREKKKGGGRETRGKKNTNKHSAPVRHIRITCKQHALFLGTTSHLATLEKTLAIVLHQEELVFTFLPLVGLQAKNKHGLLVDNWTLEHRLLSNPFKLLLLL